MYFVMYFKLLNWIASVLCICFKYFFSYVIHSQHTVLLTDIIHLFLKHFVYAITFSFFQLRAGQYIEAIISHTRIAMRISVLLI